MDLKAGREGAERIEEGSLFQNEGPATEKARDSIEDRRSLGGIVRREGSELERRERDGVYCPRRSERYEGARLLTALKIRARNLNLILWDTGSQWRDESKGEI